MSINNEDLMLVNRSGVDYKTTAADLKTYVTTEPVPTFVTASIGTETSNWSPYAQILEYPGNGPADTSNYHDSWNWKAFNRNPDLLFNGIHDDTREQFGYTVKNNYKTHLTFSYPDGIQVYDSITFKGGFYGSPLGDNNGVPCNIGTVSINGVDVLDLAANDIDPQYFEVPYTGVLTQFSIRQKNVACGNEGCQYYSHAITYIKIDGKELLNQTATTLTFEPGEFFDQIKVGTKLRQVNPKVTGVVSAVIPGENKVILDDEYPEFVTGSLVVVVGEEPPASTRAVHFNNDRILINRGRVDYQTTLAELREYVNAKPPMPWEGSYGIFHVKNATGRVALSPNFCDAWDVTPNGDGTYSWSNERRINDFNTGDEIVFTIKSNDAAIFSPTDNYNDPHNWEFGELTDVSRVTDFHLFFKGCQKFNSDISGWDTSSATNMNDMFKACYDFNQDISGWNVSKVGTGDFGTNRSMLYMFSQASSFNQDLSKWCVQHIDERPSYFDYQATAWTKPKPVWGTCP